MTQYVLQNRQSKKWIALDSYSGGYPVDVDDILRAHIWNSWEEATKYNAVMSYSHYDNPDFTVWEVQIAAIPAYTAVGDDLKAVREDSAGRHRKWKF
jgi:hypothetical protein